MRLTSSLLYYFLFLILSAAAAAASSSTPAPPPPPPTHLVSLARHQVLSFFGAMADLTCTENVVQEKLSPSGHVRSSERSQFDYLIMVQPGSDALHWNESRIADSHTKPAKPLPLLITNGFSMLLLVFHPYYRSSFHFEPEAEIQQNGRTLLPVRFSHITGTPSPAALELHGREFPLDLQGTAWLDPYSGDVVRMQASLLHSMADIGLRSISVTVDYKPSPLATARGIDLPDRAVIDLVSLHQHWRNIHTFTNYKGFSTSVNLSPTVTLVPDGAKTNPPNQPRE